MARFGLVAFVIVWLTGCASLVSSATAKVADNITLAILNQNDLETVRDGAPAYLIMIDGLIEGDPNNKALLLTGAKLYGSYTSAFVENETRAQLLAKRSLDYARRAICLQSTAICKAIGLRANELKLSLSAVSSRDLPALYEFAAAWTGWIRLNASDWNAIADISRVTLLFEHCLLLDETYDGGGCHLYLGVIKSFLPAAFGGKPEVGRQHFERALEISAGQNLMVKVLMAEHYARNIFDQTLHDELLNEVAVAKADYQGYTLINSLAKQQAARLLLESAEFF